MTVLHEQGALSQQFKATLTLGDFQGEAKAAFAPNEVVPDAQSLEGLKRGIQVQMDMGDIQDLGGAIRAADGATAAKQNDERAKKREKRDREARRLQSLLDQIEALDAHIGELEQKISVLDDKIDALERLMEGLNDGSMSVEDALGHPEAKDAVREWEKKTGKKFDPDSPDAKDVLVGLLGTQLEAHANERSDLHRQLDSAYDARSELVGQVSKIDSDLGKNLTQKRADAAELSDDGFSEAFTVAGATQTDEIATDASTFQDEFSNDAGKSTQLVSRSEDQLSGLFGDDNALDFASADFGNQFASASTPASPVENHPEPNSELKLETGLG